MTRTITRKYTLTQRDVHEAIIAWLKIRNTPAPQYINAVPGCDWAYEDDGVIVISWTEEDTLD